MGLRLLIGTVFALVLSRLIASMLFQVTPHDPATFGSIIAILLIVAVLACGVPAFRATRVDPLAALRSE